MRDLEKNYVDNNIETYKYYFNDVFGMDYKQEQIFEDLAKEVVDNTLEGYNGTIFAYGQTGSGKTYTMTGTPERYADRGIIPRTISYLFKYAQSNTDSIIKYAISYLEIYENHGYDLLDDKHTNSQLIDLPKVKPYENEQGELIFRNLSLHRADNEEDALNLLFIGETNRAVCETPMNDVSTRSHCIFIIHIESNPIGSDTKRYSKLHLVDLSGSERIKNSGVDGKLMREAIAINCSLYS